MNDLWTDDEIAELFASANPIPTSRMTEVRVGRDRATGRNSRAHSLNLGDRPLVPVDEGQRERWWLVAGVAAAVALIVSLLVTTTADDDPVPADDPDTTISVESTLDESADAVDTAEDFIAALNAYDTAAVRTMVAPDAPFSVAHVGAEEAVDRAITLKGQIAWREAWEWQWEDSSCSADPPLSTPAQASVEPGHTFEYDTIARCTFRSHNRLGDAAERSRDGDLRVYLSDGMITRAHGSTITEEWRPVVRPFLDWAKGERPEEWATAWDDDLGPLLTVESVAVERGFLDEYLALDGDVRHVYAFISALNRHDVSMARQLVVPGSTIDVVPPDEEDWYPATDLDVQFRWQAAFGWQWVETACRNSTAAEREIAQVSALGEVRCQFRHRNRLTDATDVAMAGSARFELDAEGITYVWWDANWDAFLGELNRVHDWARSSHPSLADRTWIEDDCCVVDVSIDGADALDELYTLYIDHGAIDLLRTTESTSE